MADYTELRSQHTSSPRAFKTGKKDSNGQHCGWNLQPMFTLLYVLYGSLIPPLPPAPPHSARATTDRILQGRNQVQASKCKGQEGRPLAKGLARTVRTPTPHRHPIKSCAGSTCRVDPGLRPSPTATRDVPVAGRGALPRTCSHRGEEGGDQSPQGPAGLP